MQYTTHENEKLVQEPSKIVLSYAQASHHASAIIHPVLLLITRAVKWNEALADTPRAVATALQGKF